MAPRFGPVFAHESIARTHRWQGCALRAVIVATVLIALDLVWFSTPYTRRGTDLLSWQMADLGRGSTNYALPALLGLSVPAITDGAICDEKAWEHLEVRFATDSSVVEIVLGERAPRLIPVMGPATVWCSPCRLEDVRRMKFC